MKGLGKCPAGGKHPSCAVHDRVTQRVLCPQATVSTSQAKKTQWEQVDFSRQTRREGFLLRVLNVMNSFWTSLMI